MRIFLTSKTDELTAKGLDEAEASRMAIDELESKIDLEIDDVLKQTGHSKTESLPEGTPIEIDGKIYDSNQFISDIDKELKGIDSILECLYK